MWDGVANAEVTRLVESAHAAGGVVAAVGHGTAALLDATGADGKPIIAGRQVGRHGLWRTGTRGAAAGGVPQLVSLHACGCYLESGT
jgi:putative intracellular protease/amidase